VKKKEVSYLNVYSSHISSAIELNRMPLFVEFIVIKGCVVPSVPVKHKLAVVQTAHTFLLLDDSQVTFLEHDMHKAKGLRTNKTIQVIDMTNIDL